MPNQTPAPLTPEIVSAILRDPNSPHYPTQITVFCDHCGTENTGDYMVSTTMTSEERLGVARQHLVDNEGWEHTGEGDDFCPTHASSPVAEQPVPAARAFTPDREHVNDEGRTVTTITMKRACNGCGQDLGDVTDQEMARGINGLPLPDVRRECPTCGPTAPEPKCLPVQAVDGDEACLDEECDHAVEPGADYCTNTSKHTICVTHSEISTDGTITRAEPWPCTHTQAAAEKGE